MKLYCKCHLPECVDNMRGCENKKCRKWFHNLCLGLEEKDKKWACPKCKHEHK